jgi:hypothetical protein
MLLSADHWSPPRISQHLNCWRPTVATLNHEEDPARA